MKIRKNDTVQMICGKDKGKKGKVIRVLLDEGREKVVVEGLNLQTKHVRPKKQGEKGQRIKFPAAVSVSNAMLVCPKCNRPARTGHKVLDNKKRERACKKCGEII